MLDSMYFNVDRVIKLNERCHNTQRPVCSINWNNFVRIPDGWDV